MFGGVSVFADSASLIGQKVQGLFSIEKQSGGKIADAVIINGTAYAPVRAVSEATGVQLAVEGKKIIMEDKQQTVVPSASFQVEPVASPSPSPVIEKTQKELIMEQAIAIQKEISEKTTAGMEVVKKLAMDSNNAELRAQYNQYDKEIRELQAKLKMLEEQLKNL